MSATAPSRVERGTEHTPPHSEQAEQAALGALLLERAALGRIDGLRPQDFYRPDHRLIFAAISELANESIGADVVTVPERLERWGKLDEAGGRSYIAELARDTPGAANVEHYAQIVREHSELRRLASIGTLVDQAIADGADSKEVTTRIVSMLGLRDARATVVEHPALADWPEPVNLFARFAATPFGPDLLPVQLARYPAAFAQAAGVDVGIAIVSALVAAAAAIDDRVQICGNSETAFFQQARLWALVVGEPGGGKTPTQKAMLEPLHEIHRDLLADWERAQADAQASTEPAPPKPRVLVSDTTTEALSDVAKENRRGVLVVSDEFDGWLGRLDQYKSGGTGHADRGVWLAAFDGGPRQIERVKRGSIFVENWSASILTATTPAALERLARALPSDGLIQRFIVVLARRRRFVGERPDARELEEARRGYHETIRRLWALAPRARNGVVQLSLDARERFESWRERMLVEQEALGSLEPAMEGHLAKHEALLLRVALTFHAVCVVHLPQDARDPAAYSVPLETLEHAIAFMRRVADHALAFYLGRQGGSDSYELARHIGRLILAMEPEERLRGLQRRDLLRKVRAFRDAQDGEQLTALRLLVDLGWVRVSEEGYQKAQPTRYEINPRLSGMFAAEADAEHKRRAIVRDRIAESVQQRREKKREDAAGA